MNFFKTFFFVAFAYIASLGANPAYAQNLLEKIEQGVSNTIEKIADPDDGKLVKIRLLAEKGEIQPGETIWIGIEQSITPHWHTYWKNPGDSGTPTRIKWALPEGFKISDIHWPTPKKIPYGPLLNYGYEDNVVLLQKLTAPASIPERGLMLTADIELLVCKEECIPEFGTYSLTLNSDQSAYEDNAAFISRAKRKLPQHTDQSVFFEENKEELLLTVDLNDETAANIDPETVEFLPENWGIVANNAPSEALLKGNILTITQTRGERALSEIDTLRGLITYKTTDNKSKSFAFKATPPNAHTTDNANISNLTIMRAILFALIGGIILNLMPCVFPVLSIKALSLIKIADQNPGLARMHGISYTTGVILSFVAIAALLLILKSAGMEIGWGFQLQNPVVITVLSYLLFVIGLNLMGFFEICLDGACNTGQKLTQKSGLSGSFFTGILATIVAAPCTAPFMAAALGFALTQTAIVNLTIFAALGFGLALPYLLLSFIPAFQKIMPKPGVWMNTFKEFLAFPMFLSAAWLVWVISQQAGHLGVLEVLLGMTAITFAIWLFKQEPTKKPVKYITLILGILSLSVATILALESKTTREYREMKEETAQDFGQSYSPEKLEKLLSGDEPVFVEMTAAWCITCKVNHAAAINIPSTKKLFAEKNVQYLIGDWTNQDPNITKYLNQYGRNGVPIYVYYGPRDNKTGERPEAVLLPQILKPGIFNKYF